MVPFYIDNMVIPADSPNAAAVPFLEPAVRSNTLIYPPPAVRDRTRVWLKFKSGL
jgi:hypothetical protein